MVRYELRPGDTETTPMVNGSKHCNKPSGAPLSSGRSLPVRNTSMDHGRVRQYDSFHAQTGDGTRVRGKILGQAGG